MLQCEQPAPAPDGLACTCSQRAWRASTAAATPISGATDSTTPVSGLLPGSATSATGAAAASCCSTEGFSRARSAGVGVGAAATQGRR